MLYPVNAVFLQGGFQAAYQGPHPQSMFHACVLALAVLRMCPRARHVVPLQPCFFSYYGHGSLPVWTLQ
jgi:hypothetical protein